MRGIYEFSWDCGRQGDVEGLFTADVKDVENLIGNEVFFGEILGKHSEVYGTIDENDIVLRTDDQDFVTKFEGIMGSGTISGYNPLDYYEESED